MTTQRKTDLNGWYEVARNPLSKVGVFPYLGRQLDPRGERGLEPGKVYQVLRPPEELGDAAAMDSFRLVPLVDDHTMLGDGAVPAEQKGIHGVTGDSVTFDGQTLWGNLKVFSKSLGSKIDKGKRELSLGYRCKYDFTPGVFNGTAYDAVQRGIRGNHVALVDKGRMGPEVAVLDFMTFTVDAEDWEPMRKDLFLTAAQAALAAAKGANAPAEVIAACDAAVQAAGAEGAQDAEAMAAKEKADKEAADAKTAKEAADAALSAAQSALDAANAEIVKLKGGSAQDSALVTMQAALDAANAEIVKLKATPVMDAKTLLGEVAKRDELVRRLAPHIGVFDHADKTLSEVATYGLDKLGLKNVTAGHELTALDAYLTAAPRKGPAAQGASAFDAAPKAGAISRWATPTAA